MYEWNYFYGAIMLDKDYNGFLDFINNKMKDHKYFYFHPQIFSHATQEPAYYYDNILISFGRTERWLIDDTRQLQNFIREFEDILSQLDFDHAQIKTGGINSDHSFFWSNKEKVTRSYQSDIMMNFGQKYQIRLYESEKFYFGLGEINLSTGLFNKKNDDNDLKSFDRQYKDFNYPF
jgi:hypothetical protein